MKFRAKNYFIFVIPCTVVFILLFTFVFAPLLSKVNESLTFYVFMFGMMVISLIGIYLAMYDKENEEQKKKNKNSSFPDMKTNYKHINKK